MQTKIYLDRLSFFPGALSLLILYSGKYEVLRNLRLGQVRQDQALQLVNLRYETILSI